MTAQLEPPLVVATLRPVVGPEALAWLRPTATQSLADTHETSERKPTALGKRAITHPRPPFLLITIAARPAVLSPTATQMLTEPQDRLLRLVMPGGAACLAQVAPPSRVARTEAPPCRFLPTATHSLLDAHETSANAGKPAG